MSDQNKSMLSQEWLALQNQYEHHEHSSLLIKLVAVIVFAAGFMLTLNLTLAALFVAVFWLQEGILRTFQARLGARILQVETGLYRAQTEDQVACQPFQLHTEWLRTRPGSIGLVAEYIKNAARPTVAFPYLVLLLIDLSVCLIW